MKKIIIIIASFVLLSSCASSQPVSTDSLTTLIRTLQKQVSTLQSQVAIISKIHNVTFDTASFKVVNNPDSLNQFIYLKPITATVDLSTINNQISALQTKVAALKATSITTTTIQ